MFEKQSIVNSHLVQYKQSIVSGTDIAVVYIFKSVLAG